MTRSALPLCMAIMLLASLAVGCADRPDSRAVSQQLRESDPLVVFAAASTGHVLETLVDRFTADTGIPVRCSFASSSTLARQLTQGAQADLYLSANTRWMDHLEDQDGIDATSRRDLLANRLVLIVPSASRHALKLDSSMRVPPDIQGRLAMGDPAHVPAGIYGKQAMQTLDWWASLESRVVPCRDVRSALRLVELGEVDAGVVYATDAASSEQVEVVAEFPESAHTPIRYPMALCAGHRPEAQRLLEFIAGPLGREAFEQAGFTMLPEVVYVR